MQIVNPGGNDDDHGVLDLDYVCNGVLVPLDILT